MTGKQRGGLVAAAAAISSWAHEEGYELAEAVTQLDGFADPDAREVSIRRATAPAAELGAVAEGGAAEAPAPSAAGSV